MADAEKVTAEEAASFDNDIARGIAPLVNVHAMYVLAAPGSLQEKQTEDAMADMIAKTVAEHPDKAETLIAGLLALVFHLRTGRTIFEFFEDTKQFIYPLMDANDPSAPPR